MISTQWFVKMKPMAEPALEAVRRGRTEIIPEEWAKTYDHFLENIQDWCISRQLWWGHRIPAWHGPNGEIKVARERAAPECAGDASWTQDPDVLDTWFSSALWPFSTLGWPERDAALAKFYPASDLETGYDILFFWVARMMMFGLHFMGEVPFRRVLLHGLVVDETGDKMSKVKGNVIDPLDLIHGATFAEMVDEGAARRARGRGARRSSRRRIRRPRDGRRLPRVRRRRAALHARDVSAQQQAHRARAEAHRGLPPLLNKIWNATRLALDLLGDLRGPSRPRRRSRRTEGLLQPLDPLALRGGVRRVARRASTRSASTRPRTPPTASSGTTSATGTSSS